MTLQNTSFYTCVVKNIDVTIENSEIINIIGNHASGKVNSDVQAIRFLNSKGAFLIGLSKFFFNLKLIDASRNDFNYVESIHFRGLRALEIVNFRETKVSTLFKDMFKDNPSIKFVSFFGSQIRSIEKDFLTSLPLNVKFAIGENPCVPGIPGLTLEENKLAIKNSCKLPYPLGEKLQLLQRDFDLAKVVSDVAQQNLTVALTSLNDIQQKSTTIIKELSGARDQLLSEKNDLLKQLSSLNLVNPPLGALGGNCAVELQTCKQQLGSTNVKPTTAVALKAKCNFQLDNLDYSCFAIDLEIRTELALLTNITGRHEPRRSNLDVTALLVLNQNVISLPKNMIDVFPSLNRLVVRKSNLINLSKSVFDTLPNLKEVDLKRNLIKIVPTGIFDLNLKLAKIDLSENQIAVLPSGLLKNLNLLNLFGASGNQIAAIDKDLFVATPNLVTVLLDSNKLSFIQPNTFAPLKLALTINLKNNTCINDIFSSDSILNLATSLLNLCIEDAPCN